MDEGSTRDIRAVLRRKVVPAGSKRYGLVIGIESYADPRLDLRCARADAEAMYELMIDPDCGMFAPEDVTLLLDGDARREALRTALASLRRRAGRNDTVWVYYAGHAAQEEAEFYWVPHDGDVDDLYTTGLSRGRIAQALNDLSAERVLAFLDCCHAAATAVQRNPRRAALTPEEMLTGYQGQGRVVLSASDGREKSVELKDKGHGAFTHFLVQGLRGEADLGSEGVVHLDGLWQYLEGRVSEASLRAGNRQTPRILGEHSHRLPLSLNPLETRKKKEIAEKVRDLIGLGPDRLTTEEAECCLRILRNGAGGEEERELAAEFGGILDGSLRLSTFRSLVRAAMRRQDDGSQNASAVAVHPDASAESVVTVDIEASVGALAAARKRFALRKSDALQLVDTWSVQRPKHLNPISKHADLSDFRNWSAFLVQVRALVETREVELIREPVRGNAGEVRTEPAPGMWDVPLPVPQGFEEVERRQTDASPQRVLTCPTCGGEGDVACGECHGTGESGGCPDCHDSGEWKCTTCGGSGTVMCDECRGVGNYRDVLGEYKEGRNCPYCLGEKTVPCTSCNAQPKRPCPTCRGETSRRCADCGGSGRRSCDTCASTGSLAEFPIVLAQFRPVEYSESVCEETTFSGKLQEGSSTLVFENTTEGEGLPSELGALPADVVSAVRRVWERTVKLSSGKVCRMHVRVNLVPGATVHMEKDGLPFGFHIVGIDRSIQSWGEVPKDSKHLQKQLDVDLVAWEAKLLTARIVLGGCGAALILGAILSIWLGITLSPDLKGLMAIPIVLSIACGVVMGLKLFSDHIGPNLPEILATRKRLRMEIDWLQEERSKAG